MSGPIFGNQSSGGLTSGGQRHLVEFFAGRMNMTGTTVSPDKRKGLVYLYQAEDGLIHFCWKDRTSGKVEDDLIIFPDDCEFLRVEQCKTGRVYVLKFKSSTRRLFFWLQESKTDKDDEYGRRVNDIMNNPPSLRGSGGASGAGVSSPDNNDLQYMLNNMSQQQLMQLFGGVGPMRGLGSLLGSMQPPRRNRHGGSSARVSATPSVTATPAANPNASGTDGSPTPLTPTNQSIANVTPQAPQRHQSAAAAVAAPSTPTGNGPSAEDMATAIMNAQAAVQAGGATTETASGGGNKKNLLNELQSYLSHLQTGESGAGQVIDVDGPTIDLASGLNPDAVSQLADDGERAAVLAAHLPDLQGVADGDSDASTKRQLRDTVASPQFHQALSSFSSALQTGQLGPVVAQFALDGDAVAAANSGDLEQFVKALEKKPGEAADAAVKPQPMDEDKPNDA